MRCPKCGNNHKKKLGMVCACGYAFIFDPKRDHMTDGRFTALIRQAGREGRRAYTINQLYATYCMKTKPVAPFMIACAVLFLSGLATMVFQPYIAGALILAGLISLCVVAGRLKTPYRSPEDFEAQVRLWRQAGKEMPGLIEEPSLHHPPPDWSEEDLYDYGVERMVIVERDILVDWLVLNDFHAEQRMIVIAESGYPRYLAPLAHRLIQDRADLPVFLLHDSTRQGMGMIKRLLMGGHALSAMLANHPVTDLGLHPGDVKQLKRLRPLRPHKTDYAIPVDYIPFGTLVSIMAGAMIHQIPIGKFVEERRSDTTDMGGYG